MIWNSFGFKCLWLLVRWNPFWYGWFVTLLLFVLLLSCGPLKSATSLPADNCNTDAPWTLRSHARTPTHRYQLSLKLRARNWVVLYIYMNAVYWTYTVPLLEVSSRFHRCITVDIPSLSGYLDFCETSTS